MLNRQPRYSHREYAPKVGVFDTMPIEYSRKKMKKLFMDYVEPYKTTYQILRDYLQPLVGLGNLCIGLLKMGGGLFTANKKLLADGCFTSLRGLLEIVTSPLTYFVKPFIRYGATLSTDYSQKIENNKGMKKLLRQGSEYCASLGDSELTPIQGQKLADICRDLSRKYRKAKERGQYTIVDENLEIKENLDITRELKGQKGISKNCALSYLSIFPPKMELEIPNTQNLLKLYRLTPFGF
jgi:hypothetical protein